MALKCPECLTENPDRALFCSECGRPFGRSGLPSTSGVTAPSRYNQDALPLDAMRSFWNSPLSVAAWAVMTAVALLSLSFVLEIYFVEVYVLDHWNYMGGYTLSKVIQYTSGFGDLAAIIGFLFIVTALMKDSSRTGMLNQIAHARLDTVKVMLILAAIVAAVSVSYMLTTGEFGIGFDGMLEYRLIYYLPRLTWLLTAGALLAFTIALKDAAKSAY